MSFAISNTFLMYIVGKKEWLKLINEPPTEHLTGFISIWIFTAIFYFVFARFREMVCIVVCPYGRLQGVLLDNNSILVQYDHKRGETRGKISKTDTTEKGDCIDCHWCVRVCPTGIDIRNGSNQLECIGCTACIDACDEVMEKVKKPKNLIRYDSLNGINSGTKLKFSKRIMAYSALLVMLLSVFGYLLLRSKTWVSTLLRTQGMTLLVDEKKHEVSNLYQLEILNKSLENQNFKIEVEKPFYIVWVGKPISNLEKSKMSKSEFFIKVKSGLKKDHEKIKLLIINSNGETETLKTSFIQPDE